MRLTHRLQFIKLTVLLGLFCSVVLSYNLWGGPRFFPKAHLFANFQSLQAPFDYLYLILLVILIIVSFLSQSKIPTLLLILFSFFLCIDDQNRLQPWFYNYILILFVLLFYKQRVDESNNYTSIFITIQILVSLIYIYSGLQKFNSHFTTDTLKWLVVPFQDNFSERQINLFLKLGHSIPYLECFIGIGLLIKPLRYLAIPIVIAMHLFILVFLGPLGNNYNPVVWPWNIVMIILNLLLFANVGQERFFDISILFKDVYFYIVITLMLIFPIFSFNNKYDSYLSSSLYSGNTHDCVLILSDNAYNKLPYYIKNFVSKNADYNQLNIKKWAITELNVPCVPEYRIFESVQNYIIHITQSNTQEVKINFTEREKIINF
jgi:hypothetical protein